MRIRKIGGDAAGPSGVLRSGQEYDLPDDLARQLIDGGYAVPVKGPGVDTATAEPQAETAEAKPRRKRATKPKE